VPLLEGDRAAVLDLQAVLDEVYRKGGLARRIDYAADPAPPLADADREWARQCVATRGA
jgi:hypothetical protein